MQCINQTVIIIALKSGDLCAHSLQPEASSNGAQALWYSDWQLRAGCACPL